MANRKKYADRQSRLWWQYDTLDAPGNVHDANRVDLRIMIIHELNSGLDKISYERIVVSLDKPACHKAGFNHHDVLEYAVGIGLNIDSHIYRVIMLEHGGFSLAFAERHFFPIRAAEMPRRVSTLSWRCDSSRGVHPQSRDFWTSRG